MSDQSKPRRPHYRRAETPPPMRFQDRDGDILQAIYDYDGILAGRHLKQLFWSDKSSRAMLGRLSLLYHNAYLDKPSEEQQRTKPIPERVIWLGWRGILWVASQRNIKVEAPQGDNEYQLRLLQRNLREQGIRWLREPRWIQLKHDLAVVDFRLAVEKAIAELPSLTLEKWISEGVFRSETDVVDYTVTGRDGKPRKKRKGVIPDSFFLIVDALRKIRGDPARARFLLELDEATHDNPSFGREKVAPYAV